jgi:hypothetical protein
MPWTTSVGVITYNDASGTPVAYELHATVGVNDASGSPTSSEVLMQLRQEGLTWHVAGDDVVVLDLEGAVYLKLNGSARVLWERLDAPCTESDLVAALVEHFGIDPERAAADVTGFVAELRRRELLAD